MSRTDTAVVFAGQGKLSPAGFACSAEVRPYLDEVYSQIDEVSLERIGIAVSDVVASASSGGAFDSSSLNSGTLELAIFGASVAAYRFLLDDAGAPAVLLGHGFSELTALVCAGSLSVTHGAQIVCERSSLLKAMDRSIGYMGVLHADSFHARKIISRLHSDYICAAAENSPVETVISGRKGEMNEAVRLAEKHGFRFSRLVSPYALHCRALMQDASHALASAVGNIPSRTPQVPVFSSWLGRYYRHDDAVPSLLASYLARPFRFADAVWQLCRNGVETYVECGVLRGVSRHVENTISRRTAPVIIHADLMTQSLSELEQCIPIDAGAAHASPFGLRVASVH